MFNTVYVYCTVVPYESLKCPVILRIIVPCSPHWTRLGFSGDHRDLNLPSPRVTFDVCAPRGGVSHELVEGSDASSNDDHMTVAGGVDNSPLLRVVEVRPLAPAPRGRVTYTGSDTDGCG
jgi:hypothetical protein